MYLIPYEQRTIFFDVYHPPMNKEQCASMSLILYHQRTISFNVPHPRLTKEQCSLMPLVSLKPKYNLKKKKYCTPSPNLCQTKGPFLAYFEEHLALD